MTEKPQWKRLPSVIFPVWKPLTQYLFGMKEQRVDSKEQTTLLNILSLLK